MDNGKSLRQHLIDALRGGQAFDTFEAIVADVPADRRGVVPPGAEHSAWQILEHMRIAQRDILDFSRNHGGSYRELKWPDEYWPASPSPPDSGAWDRSVAAFLGDRGALEALVADDASDLFAPFPWGDGQTLLREALLAAEHAAYHLGQVVIVRGLVGQ
jgi:hypothetical protein